ncbi:hypothetical protein [Acetobacter fallax]|uniref:Uncharacterized protein n=1 Tax=Acetobacter fallax TaxID=1737473 RepID=A0ABX0KC66_9PROT|nr:hypothetical protein [Acetobacter fallax]NHO31562.1 hypothetical protein [Acetobacter fallax]NHO35121.1 hypothetical protein [Acetobacter fallax]
MHRYLPAIAVFVIFLACTLISHLVALPPTASLILSFAGAAIAASITAAAMRTHADSSQTAPATPDFVPEISPKLRHDLRGIISPAVLCADQLSTYQDETVRNRAEQILTALDLATDRLRTART